MGYLGKIGSLITSSFVKPLSKAVKSPNTTKQLYGSLIGTSKSGVEVFRQVAKDVVTTTSFKNGKMFKQIKQFARTGNDAKTIVKNFSDGTITNIMHKFGNNSTIRSLYKYTKKLGELAPLKALKEVTAEIYKNGISLIRTKSLDGAKNGYKLNIMRKGKDIISKNLKFINNGKAQTVSSDPLNILL